MEYVIVEFAEPREVLIDGLSQGLNKEKGSDRYRVLMVDGGRHTVELRESGNQAPVSQTVVVGGTSPINPLRVAFDKQG